MLDTFFSWFFDGLGTEIVSLLIGGIAGSAIGYKVGVNKSIKQSQSAGDDARQTQTANITSGKDEETATADNSIKQCQEASNHAVQVQTGRISHGTKSSNAKGRS